MDLPPYDDSCNAPPPDELLQGIAEFNAGEWFACHETLEELWAGERRSVRNLYQGMLHVAVALHHWRGGNYGGACRLLESGARMLEQVSPACQGVDTATLAANARLLREALVSLGEERMAELDRTLIPQVRLAGSPR